MKTVTLKNGQIASVQTLLEWVNQRIAQIRQAKRVELHPMTDEARVLEGRLAEMLIVREKLLDGRIQGLGFEFKEGE